MYEVKHKCTELSMSRSQQYFVLLSNWWTKHTHKHTWTDVTGHVHLWGLPVWKEEFGLKKNVLTHKKTHTNMGAERGRNRCCGTDMHTHSHFSVLTHSLNIRFVWAKPSMARRHPNLKTQISHSLHLYLRSFNSWTTIHRPTLHHLHRTHPYLVLLCLSSCPSFLPCSNLLERALFAVLSSRSSWMGGWLSASHSSREPNPWTSKQNVTS